MIIWMAGNRDSYEEHLSDFRQIRELSILMQRVDQLFSFLKVFCTHYLHIAKHPKKGQLWSKQHTTPQNLVELSSRLPE